MKHIKKSVIIIILTAIAFFSNAQEITQTIRGKIIDQDSKSPLIGSHVVITNSDQPIGAVADVEGYFRIENVPVGRVNIKISSLGYEDKLMQNVLVGSGKEIVLTIELVESVLSLSEISVSSERNKAESVNEMATVSAKTFSVEETSRYAGSLNDPARMVSSFAGVTGDAMGNNDIVVRGNSPRGILWRLDGVEIPNPNHFANEGSTGGPVNSLNPSMLANSDFYSGAFSPEYGNALSGVFDIHFRSGNNEKAENSFSAGIIGIDFTTEGPFSKNSNGSYLVNYRYSSIDILDMLGVLNFGGVPKYQDAAFKIDLPTKKHGKFSVFGLGGESHIREIDEDEKENTIYADMTFKAHLGVVGINHSYIFNEKSYLKSYISASTAENGYNEKIKGDDGSLFNSMNEKYNENKLSYSSVFHQKLNSKNKIQAGFIITRMGYNMNGEEDFAHTGIMNTLIDQKDYTGMFQGFTSWKYRLNEKISIISGIHYTQFMLNKSHSLEPRASLKWEFRENQSFSVGYGLHSKPERISVYLSNTDDSSSENLQNNRELEFTKAAHYVLGYDNMLSQNIHFHTEIYYQQLFDIPVENNIHSAFAISNSSEGFTTRELVNKGTGRNYGLELTFERFFSHNLYYLLTASLYESKYTAMDGIERDSRYNANYAGNLVIGKEFPVGRKSKNKTIGVNTRISFLGANMYTPIDLDASIASGHTVFDESKTFSVKGDDVFFMNIGLTYRRERPKTTQEFCFDIRNITNNQAVVMQYYNPRIQNIEEGKQLPFIPNIVYTIKF